MRRGCGGVGVDGHTGFPSGVLQCSAALALALPMLTSRQERRYHTIGGRVERGGVNEPGVRRRGCALLSLTENCLKK